MLICKIISVRKFIHGVASIITFDCRDDYSDIQRNPTRKVGSAKKTKNALGAREIAFAAVFVTQIICRRNTDDIPIIMRRMSTEKRAIVVGIPRQGAGIRQESQFSR